MFDRMTGGELVARSRVERLVHAQLLVLQATYHELRHGHDLAARQIEVMTAHTEALIDHAGTMDKHRGALADYADGMSRHRPEGR